MPSIQSKVFGGIRPAISDKAVQDVYATVAHNVCLETGTVQPLREPKLLGTNQDKIRTLYKTKDSELCCSKFLTWDDCACVVPIQDPGCRGLNMYAVFYDLSCARDPEIYDPCTDEFCVLGITPPFTALLAQEVTPGVSPTPDEVSYVYTWVDKFGIESQPSMPSNCLKKKDDAVVSLSNISEPPMNACFMRVYRTTSPFLDGTQVKQGHGVSYQLIDEIEIDFNNLPTSFLDNYLLKDILGGTLQTEEDCPPPKMCKVVDTEGGWLVGYKNNRIYVSDRNRPWSFPEVNTVELPDRILGIVPHYDSILVVTTGSPYTIAITTSEDGTRVIPSPFGESIPATKGDTLSSTPFGAVYVSERGLVALQPNGNINIITAGRVQEKDWNQYRPDLGTYFRGKYYGFRTNGDGIIIDIKDGVNDTTILGDLVTHSVKADRVSCGYDGKLYIARDNQYFLWGQGDNNLTYKWRSKLFGFGGIIKFNAAKVVGCFGDPVKLRLFKGCRKVAEKRVRDNRGFRLPPMGRDTDWMFEIEGNTEVCEVHIATSLQELTEETR